MQLSRKADYALRAVKHLSSLPKGKLGSINSIAAAEAIPREFLAKILKDLTRGGILSYEYADEPVYEAYRAGSVRVSPLRRVNPMRSRCSQIGTTYLRVEPSAWRI